MRKVVWIMGIVIVGSILMSYTQLSTHADTVQSDPSYAKWGQVAMKETKANYPNADIIDYLHIGRETGQDTSIEKFKLWLRENNKEFGVFIDITFDNETEEMTNITLRKTDQ